MQKFFNPRLDVITGPMFSGKSTELIRRMRNAGHARLKTITFKPICDNRTDQSVIDTHDGCFYDVIVISHPREVWNFVSKTLEDGSHVICGFDEVQLFKDEDIIEAYEMMIALAESGRHVFVAGLDNDYRGASFELIKLLMPYAFKVKKMHSVCVVCGAKGSRSQRITHETERVLIGGKKNYEARCPKHFDKPNGTLHHSVAPSLPDHTSS